MSRLAMWSIIGVLLAALLLPITVSANHQVTRLCMDAPDATAVTINLYFRTTNTGTAVVKAVPRASLTSDPVKCPAPQVGILVGSLGLPDSATYFVKASGVNAAGHESALSAEAGGTPFPLDATSSPGVPQGLGVK